MYMGTYKNTRKYGNIYIYIYIYIDDYSKHRNYRNIKLLLKNKYRNNIGTQKLYNNIETHDKPIEQYIKHMKIEKYCKRWNSIGND